MSSSNKHLPASERRAITVEAVIDLAAEQNPSTITTAAIAARMGLTQGAIFRHFPNKEAILEAVMEWVSERLLARVDRATKAEVSPLVALEKMFMAHVEFITKYPGIPRMLFGELQRREKTPPKIVVQTLIHRYSGRLQNLFEKGKSNGELDPELDSDAAAILFIGTLQGLVMQSLLAGDFTRIRRDAPGAFAIYLRGVRNS